MGYVLLTGATGLLGTYLLRDLLGAGFRLALITRPSKVATARQRIEEIMVRWEKQAGYSLPRPVIFEGNLTQQRLGLDKQTLDWIRKHCDAFLHNGASVTFVQDRYGDPWRSNVEGVKNVLGLCRDTEIRKYHHVSTAYVCGLRQGLISESDLDLGQEFANDYERSKLAGEKLVRADESIEPPTIYRPSIIIGDSLTGYTSTFHGLYAPLRLAHAMVKRIVHDQVDIDPLQEALQLNGGERKHLVPVDWVSALITHILAHPEHHGETYHLVPNKPVTIAVMRDAMVRAFLSYSDMSRPSEGAALDWKEFTEYFTEEMRIYQAYWRDDPQFDRTNTERAAPHLPCPVVNFEMLLETCRYALGSNFGWPRVTPPALDFDVGEQLQELLKSGNPGVEPLRLDLQLNGPGGGQWHLELRGTRPVSVDPGLRHDSDGTLYLNTYTWMRLLSGELSVRDAVQRGWLVIETQRVPPRALQGAMQKLMARSGAQPALSSRDGTGSV